MTMRSPSGPSAEGDGPFRSMYGPRVRHRLATRRAIEAAAIELVADRGFDAVTARDVATAVDMTERTFYRYCPAKVDAFRFVLHGLHWAVGFDVREPAGFSGLCARVARDLAFIERDPADARGRLLSVVELVVSDSGLAAAMAARDALQLADLQRTWRGADPFAVPLVVLVIQQTLRAWVADADVALEAVFRGTCAQLGRAVAR